MQPDPRLDALAEAGSQYDAAVRAVWAAIDPDLGTQQSWRVARPGTVVAQQQLDADLARIRSEYGTGEPAPRHSWQATADERTKRCRSCGTTATKGGVPCGMPKAIEYRRAGRLAIAEHVPPCGPWETEQIAGEYVSPDARLPCRPLTFAEETAARLAAAGFTSGHPAVARIRGHNALAADRAADRMPGTEAGQ